MKKRIKLESKFHGTETTVIAETINDYTYRINERQYRAAQRRLCVPGCNCLITAGEYMIEGFSIRNGFEMAYDLVAVEEGEVQ